MLRLILGSLIASFLCIAPVFSADKIAVTANVRNFSGGFNNTTAPHYLADGQSPDMLNVVIDDPLGVVKQRDGYAKCGSTPSGKLASRIYEYRKSTGERFLIISDNEYFWQTKDCQTFTQIAYRANNNTRPDFTVLRDKLWTTYQSSNVFVWDSVTTTVLNGTSGTSNPPKAKYITTWNDRIWLANTADQPSAVYFSSLADTKETIAGATIYDPVTSTGAFPAINAFYVNREDGASITGIKPFRGRLFVFKNTGIWYITFENETNNALTRSFSNIGCNYGSTVVEMENMLYFLGADGYIYKTDGVTVARASDNIEAYVDSIKQPVGNNIVINWTENWQGTIDPALSVDTQTWAGEIRLSTQTTTYLGIVNPTVNELYGWTTENWNWSGTYANTFITGIRVACGRQSPYDIYGLVGGTTFYYLRTTLAIENPPSPHETIISSAAIEAAYLLTFSTPLVAGTTVTWKIIYPISGNANQLYQTSTWYGQNIRSVVGIQGIGPGGCNISGGSLGETFDALYMYNYYFGYVNESDADFSYDYDSGNDNTKQVSATLYFNNDTYYDGISIPSLITNPTVTVQSSTSTTGTYSTIYNSTPTNLMWDNTTKAYKANITFTADKRYLKIGSTHSANNGFLIGGLASSGTFTNDPYDFSGLSAYGAFTADYQTNGGTVTFQYRLSSSTAMDVSSTTAWTDIVSGSIISGTTDYPVLQWRAIFGSESTDYQPVLSGITVEVSSGSYTANVATAIFYKGRYILAVTTGTSLTNNTVLMRSRFGDAWMPFDWGLSDFTLYGQNLYATLTSTNDVVSLFNSTLDGSNTITSYWQSKDYHFDSPMYPKYIEYLYADYKIGLNNALNIGYSIDEGATWYNYALNASAGNGSRGGKWLNITPRPASLYRFRIYNNTPNIGYTFYGLDTFGYATQTRSDR